MIIDFHTHCFADSVYDKAIKSVSDLVEGAIKPHHDGSLAGLSESMRYAGVDISIVLSIATKATQTKVINDWAISIQSNTIIPFGTIHPDYREWETEIDRLKSEGIKGIKFHPDYQEFDSDDRKLYPIYEKIAQEKLIALFHCGWDEAFPNKVRNTPIQMRKVLDDIPKLTIVGAHMGGYKMYDEVNEHLVGTRIYLDTSFAHSILGDEKLTKLIKTHGADKVLFGTDTPWDDSKKQVKTIRSLSMSPYEKDMIFYKNAINLLRI